MAGYDLIDAYLSELDRALGLPRRARRRVGAEVRDHLACAVTVGRAEGFEPAAACERAIAAFGAPDVVARRFAEQLAVDATRRATRAVLVAVAAYGAVFAASTQIAAVRAASPFAADPADAIAWFAAQIAATCAALTAARALRHRRDAALPAGKLRYMNRGAAVAVGAVLVSVGADAVAAVAAPAAGAGGTTRLLLLAAVAAVGAIAVGGLGAVARATVRTRALARLDDRPADDDDILDDVLALAGAVERMPLAARGLTGARRLAPALRAHPWRLGALTALAAGLVLTATHLVAEGPPTDGALVALAVAGIIVGIEGAAVLVCFAVLGRFLGLRR
jgi:hypothetical protein